MPTHSTDQIPPRKDNWKLPDEPYMKDKRFDYERAWKQFSEMFRSQPERELKSGNQYRPNLELIEWRELNP